LFGSTVLSSLLFRNTRHIEHNRYRMKTSLHKSSSRQAALWHCTPCGESIMWHCTPCGESIMWHCTPCSESILWHRTPCGEGSSHARRKVAIRAVSALRGTKPLNIEYRTRNAEVKNGLLQCRLTGQRQPASSVSPTSCSFLRYSAVRLFIENRMHTPRGSGLVPDAGLRDGIEAVFVGLDGRLGIVVQVVDAAGIELERRPRHFLPGNLFAGVDGGPAHEVSEV